MLDVEIVRVPQDIRAEIRGPALGKRRKSLTADKVQWQELVDAEQRYVSLRVALHASGDEAAQLRLAFQSRQGAEMALRYVRDAHPSLIVELLPELVEFAMTTTSQVMLAREVVGRVPPENMHLVTKVAAKRALTGSDVRDFEFRKVLQFLLFADDDATIREVLDMAAHSMDTEIRNLVEEYRGDMK